MQYRKEAVSRQILDSAMLEFDEKGYTDASVRAIAERAETSVGNVYRYFRNKDELFVSCLMPVLDECIDWTGKVFDISSREAICFTAARISDYIDGHSREFRLICQGPAVHYAAFLSRYAACIVRQLRHMADGELANPAILDTLASAFIGGMRQIMESDSPSNTKDKHLLEFMMFLFGDFKDRRQIKK